uniref:Ankyrin repeat domain-containing protein 17 n=1 Tax=Sphenodon punctatus TaxID=8508 RepID=A0A8D0GUT8_SPHPU
RSLAEACSEGDVNAVRKLLIEGRSVNEHTEEGESLLCLACSAGYYELAQVLLAMHANVEDRGIKGDITPLMAAANGGHVKIVKLLLAHGADVNAQSSTGNTALTYACAGGYVDVVKVLLESGASIEDHNENGHTPLMEAGSAGHVEVARLLLENGAGINTHSNEFKESALTLACYKGHLEMVRFLLEAGTDQEHKTDEMHTALMEACMDGHVEVARLLLNSGAQVNMPADSFESPLTLAACGGHVELAALLIERGANLEEVNDEGYTPLMEAAREGHEEMVALLLGQGANINAQTEETQETALTLACCGGFLEVADFLIKAGADIELGCSTPLMEAAQEGHLELVKYLLAAGANVHATTATGDTALTYACENGHTDVADVLLQAGADLEHESEGGRTPLMKAARAGHVCTVQFLISKGANVNRTTANNDHTVLSLACAGGHLAVVELLLAHGSDPTHRLKDGSTMLIEAAKGGHTSVVCYLLDYPNNLLSAPPPDATQLTPPSHDLNRAPRVPVQALPMVVPPQEPDKPPANVVTTLPIRNKAASKQKSNSHLPASNQDVQGYITNQSPESIVEEAQGKLTELEQRIKEAIEKNAQLQSLELAHADQLTKEKIEELNKTREEQIQKKQKILEELQKVERELQLKTQQQLKKQYLEVKAQRIQLQQQQQSCQHLGLLTPVGVGEQLTEGDYARLQQVDPILLKDDPQPMAQMGFAPIQPLAMPQALPLATSSLPPGPIASLTELQGVIVGQPVLGQAQLTGLGQGILTETQQGLMVSSPAQTLNDTLDDIMAAVSGRASAMSNTPTHSIATSVSQPQTPTPSPIISPSTMLPIYPAIDIDAQTESNHDTALTLACAGGHEELVQTLLERGANIEHRDKKGFTPLILAATAGHVGVVEILLDNGADIEAQSERTKDTPLSLACSGGRQEVVELLLARGANKEHRNVSDYTPLSLAASGGYVNIIKILLNAGAEINSRTGSKLGISPLMLAAMNGHTTAVKLLLDMGSDINAQIETNRNTALTLACFQGRTEVVSLLLDRKANVEHRAKTGLTPLMEAASGGYAEVGRVLLDKGADVNAPPVPSSRDTALTIAADKGHYKFCELLISRGAHIDVRNKKGNTPLWLAANGGHLDVVQLLVQAGADVDAADNRKITPLMAAFRKGHVKVVRYLVKEVNQFPSDSECMRYIATITDKEMLKKCHLCMESIVQAKDRQAAEANKNASILLEELDLEKLREESRRLALAAKREKRKEKRRKKKEEQRRKLEEIEAKNKENFELQAAQEKEKLKAEDEPEVLTEPPSATTTTTIGISATWTTLAGSHGKRSNTITTTSSKRKSRKSKIPSDNVQLIFDDQLPISYAPPEKINGESKSSSTSESGDSDNMRISSCSDESSNSNSSHKSDPLPSAAVTNPQNNKKQPAVLVMFPKEERKVVSGKSSIKLSEVIGEVTGGNSLSTCAKSGPSPLSSPNGKLTLASPKRGQKREEGWKEVVRRSKKVSVPPTVISRVIGRGGCNINAIREFTGAHIDIDKQKDKTGDRIITIRGGTESTRQATQLINALIKDPDKEIDELIPKNRLKSSAANSKVGSLTAAGTAAAVNSNALMGIKVTTVAVSSTSQAATVLPVPAIPSASVHKSVKNPVNNVRPRFPVSLPLAYPPPQFAHALLAAQTFQQIRPPRLPMTHFGGTFPPAQSTWGPFPVRPLSPARVTNSPKPHMVPRHNSSGPQVNSASSSTSSPTASSTVSTVPGPSTNGSPSSPSVRRQLFVTVVKTSNATTTTVTTTASNNSTTPTNATYPVPTAKEHYPVSSPTPPSPPAQPAGVSRNSPSDCMATSPNKGVSSSDQEVGSPPAVESGNSTSSRQPSTGSVGSSSVHAAHQQPVGALSQEARPPHLQQPQVPPQDPRMVVPPNLAAASSSAPAAGSANAPMTYPLPQASVGSTQPPAKMETPAIRPPSHGTNSTHKSAAPVQNSSVAVINMNPIKRPHSVPSSVQLPSTLSTQSASQNPAHPASKSMAANFSAALPFGPFSTLFENGPASAQHAFWGGSVVSSQTPPESILSGKSSFLPNSDPLHPSDTSKAPGFRPPLQRPAPSPSGIVSMDSHYAPATPSSTHLGNFASNLSRGQMYAQGAPLGGAHTAANFNRQHFSPLSLLPPCSSASSESPPQSVASGVRAPSPAPSAVSLGSEKPSNVSQDRKVPVPIGTERSARIRQTGSSTPSVIGSNLAAPVGHSGIWSFEGIGGNNQDKVDWCHGAMGNMIHRPMSDPGMFSQHQAMERESTGIVAPSGTFHQHVPAGYMDFPKVGGMPFSVYGNAMIPPIVPITDGSGGPIFNGPHAADPSWNSLIKMVSNSTENNAPQTVWAGTWAPHMNGVHMNQLG